MSTHREPEEWIGQSLPGAPLLIITSYIFKRECMKIRSGQATYTTNYLKLWSVLCLLCGPIQGLSTLLRYMDGLCYITWYIRHITLMLQPIFMGFYQLSRLYYCFSQNQVYSDKGYPSYLFIVMFIIGAALFLLTVEYPIAMHGFPTKCGWIHNDNYQFIQYTEKIESFKVNDYGGIIILAASVLIYLSWDLVTLSLYINKIKGFKKFKSMNLIIFKRILDIMYRVCVLTLFYQIGVVVSTVPLVISSIIVFPAWLSILLGSFPTIFISLSMFLMLEHNTKEYGHFLRAIYRIKLYYLCCCYRRYIIESIAEMDENVVSKEQSMTSTKNGDQLEIQIGEKSGIEKSYETHDISMNHGRVINEALSENQTCRFFAQNFVLPQLTGKITNFSTNMQPYVDCDIHMSTEIMQHQ